MGSPFGLRQTYRPTRAVGKSKRFTTQTGYEICGLARNAQLPRGTSVAACGSSAPMPLRGTRSRAIRRRASKEGANLGKGASSLERASALKPQQRKQKKQRKEAS